MKLYYSPGACSLSPHIVLKELELPFTLVKVDTKKKQTENGEDFLKINPKGQVPVLELDSGEFLTEGVAIVQYLANLVPEKGLVPIGNSMEKYRLLEWLNFLTSEIHKGFSPLFAPELSEDAKQYFREKLKTKFQGLEKTLGKNNFLMGESFTVADAYLFTVANWAQYTKVEVPQFLMDYSKRVAQRSSVQAAMRDEGLVQK